MNKPKFNITTKCSSRRQVLTSISMENSEKFMVLSYKHVTNINEALKNIKSDIIVDYIRNNYRGLTITINKVTSTLDLNTIEKYIKNINSVEFDNIIMLKLLQSKSYLKILDVPYLIEDSNVPITSNVIERVI